MLGGGDLGTVLSNATVGHLVDPAAPPVRTASRLVEGLRARVNAELAARGERARADIYISCPDCVRAGSLAAVGGRVPLLRSDAYKLMGVTGKFALCVFRLRKRDFLFLLDLVVVLKRFVSPLFELVLSSNVEYTVNPWGLPFVNRVAGLSVGGVRWADLPPFLGVATSAVLGSYFWKVEAMTKGLVSSMPRDFSPAAARIATAAENMRWDLPMEWELMARFLEDHEDD